MSTAGQVTNEDALWKLEEVGKNYVKVRSRPPTAIATKPAKRKNTDDDAKRILPSTDRTFGQFYNTLLYRICYR